MNDLQPMTPRPSITLKDLYNFAVFVGRIAVALQQQLVTITKTAERQHHRAELLAAYRHRHVWKKSDIPRLQSLGVNSAATKRMAQLTGRGRPVVKPHRSIWHTLASNIGSAQKLVDPNISAYQRRQALKSWPWWSHYVEALYRGEHALAKSHHFPQAADHAEHVVGDVLGLSAATVHKICGTIRHKRREWEGAANFPAMTLAEFKEWMKTGNNSRWLERTENINCRSR